MTVTLRRFESSDIAFALAQTQREGWTSCRAWFEIVAAHDPDLCFIALDGGARAGMITATRFAATAWVGNLIVIPERRRSGLGTRLMEHVLGLLGNTGVRTVRLEADPPGVNIYRRLGFAEELESLRFRLPSPIAACASGAVSMNAEALAALPAFDRPRFGDDRARLLRLISERTDAAFGVWRDGSAAGYAMLVAAIGAVTVGPWLADDPLTAAELLDACLAAAGGREVRVGIPASNRAGCELLRARGFEETAPSLRMVLGEPRSAGDAAAIYGILNGAVG